MDLSSVIENDLHLLFGIKKEFTCVKLAGDISSREYYRITFEDTNTLIVMKCATELFKASESTNLTKKVKQPPFINIARLLEKENVRVPQIYYHNKKEELIYLEDFGDTLLYDLFQKEGESERVINLCKSAIDKLVHIQSIPKQNGFTCFNRSFDESLYAWELDHFFEYAIKSYPNIKCSYFQEKEIRKEFSQIVRKLSSLELCLGHRDYHSKNLMVLDENPEKETIGILDFQDALLAPNVYDLASFLRDAYSKKSNELEKLLYDYYVGLSQTKNINEFRYSYELISLERNLKALGRFFYFDLVKKRDTHLRFVPLLLDNIFKSLSFFNDLPVITDLFEKNLIEIKKNAKQMD